MKKIFAIIAAASALSLASCKKVTVSSADVTGTLSFAEFAISCDDDVETKATVAATGNYVVSIYNTDTDELAVSTTYTAVKQKDNKLSLPAGNYRLEARSSGDAVAVAAFEQPVYGATREFSITAGQTTSVGALICRLLQCKVTVGYSDDFLAMVTGEGSASVEVTSGYPLNYALNYSNGAATYDQSAGFFAVDGTGNTTMVVTFKGSIDGKSQKMTKTFTDIKARQWRQVKFIKKVNEKGNAAFDIVINPLVDDAELPNDIADAKENIIGDDPSAPKGDGGITLDFDYEAGCDVEFTDMGHILMPPVETRDICLKMKSEIPNGVKKFIVQISSTNDEFVNAVAAAQAQELDLVHPTSANEIIFQVVPFPHGEELLGKTNLSFDLSNAQDAIISYKGTHTFQMIVTDTKGCKSNLAPVVMVVE